MRHNRERFAAQDEFEEKADDILRDYAAGLDAAANPYCKRLNVFKRQSYSLIRRTISAEGGHKVIKSIVRNCGVQPYHLHYVGNEFHFGLLAIDPHKSVLFSRRIHLMSRQLAYAFKNNVEARYLVGFLWQSGPSAQIAQKLKDGFTEPEFGTAPQ